MGFQLKGNIEKVKKVSGSMDGVLPNKGTTVKVQAAPKKEDKSKGKK
jgi:hypothetical protein